MGEGTRSGLWSEFAKAIDEIRPDWVVIENVRGLLSANANGGDVEPCPWCLGDDGEQHALRALGAVLGDLAELGFDAEWTGIRASDIGAPHGRFRVFILAWPAERTVADSGRGRGRGRAATSRGGEGARTDVAVDGADPRDDGTPETASLTLLPTPVVTDSNGARNATAVRCHGSQHHSGTTLTDAVTLLPTPTVGNATGGNAQRGGDRGDEKLLPGLAREHATDWGPYEAAIRRWEASIGRPAPAPVRFDGKGGKPRLNPELTEWMMGWPAGHVTDPAIGLTRAEQLKACGNGVVPAQAAAALREMLSREGVPHVRSEV